MKQPSDPQAVLNPENIKGEFLAGLALEFPAYKKFGPFRRRDGVNRIQLASPELIEEASRRLTDADWRQICLRLGESSFGVIVKWTEIVLHNGTKLTLDQWTWERRWKYAACCYVTWKVRDYRRLEEEDKRAKREEEQIRKEEQEAERIERQKDANRGSEARQARRF